MSKRNLRIGATAMLVAALIGSTTVTANAYTKHGGGINCPDGSWAAVGGRTEATSGGQNRRAYLNNGNTVAYIVPASYSGVTFWVKTSWEDIADSSAYGNIAAYWAASDCFD